MEKNISLFLKFYLANLKFLLDASDMSNTSNTSNVVLWKAMGIQNIKVTFKNRSYLYIFKREVDLNFSDLDFNMLI